MFSADGQVAEQARLAIGRHEPRPCRDSATALPTPDLDGPGSALEPGDRADELARPRALDADDGDDLTDPRDAGRCPSNSPAAWVQPVRRSADAASSPMPVADTAHRPRARAWPVTRPAAMSSWRQRRRPPRTIVQRPSRISATRSACSDKLGEPVRHEDDDAARVRELVHAAEQVVATPPGSGRSWARRTGRRGRPAPAPGRSRRAAGSRAGLARAGGRRTSRMARSAHQLALSRDRGRGQRAACLRDRPSGSRPP